MTSWPEFYADRGEGYVAYCKDRYAPFINAIRGLLKGGIAQEIGAGTGTISRIIADADSRQKMLVCDKDPAMLDRARQRFTKHINQPIFVTSDARYPMRVPGVDVVHSHGLLEHFSDPEIRQIIAAHRYAQVQVHYVPGLYEKPSFGDERLMPLRRWVDICKPTHAVPFNSGLDYILIFCR